MTRSAKLSIAVVLIVSLLALGTWLRWMSPRGASIRGNDTHNAATQVKYPDSIVLSVAGDCTFGAVNGDSGPGRFPSVYRRSGVPDYPFHLVRPWFADDDLTLVNFEGTLTGAISGADKQWHFAGDGRYASIFPASSVELAGLANNHAHDYLDQGFQDTIASFHASGMPVVYQDKPYVVVIKGVEIVVIADCTVAGENTTLIDGVPGRVLGQIKRYKRPDNVVIVFMHWGSELDKTPRPWQISMAHSFVDAGADTVVGAHPHVLQGIERYKGKYIAYSLGNFAFGGNSMARNPDTVILQLQFPVTNRKAGPATISMVPCLVTSSHARNGAGELRNNYQPIPLTGESARRTTNLVLQRSAQLQGGVKSIWLSQLRAH